MPVPSFDATGETCDYVCEGCGLHVFACGIPQPPAHGLCGTCAWLCEHVPDPEEMMKLRKIIDPYYPFVSRDRDPVALRRTLR
jgi:hypothetical protein